MGELTGPSYLLLALTIIALVQAGFIWRLWKRANDQDEINAVFSKTLAKHKHRAKQIIDEWET